MIVEKIRQAAEKNPDKLAYQSNGTGLTYRELWSSAERYAPLLKKQDTSPVILYGHKEPYMVISMLACLIAGRAYVPVGSCTPPQRVQKIVDLTGSTLIITGERLDVRQAECCTLQELERYTDRPEKLCGSELAYILFTSGSTGEPKGVPISKSNLDNFVRWICRLAPLDGYRDIRVLNQASFSFDLSVADLYYSLCTGNTLIAYAGSIPEGYAELFDLFRDEAINAAVMTPTFMKLCLTNDAFTGENYPDLRCVYFCGEILEKKTVRTLLERFPELAILNAYGPTEATSAVSAIRITREMLEDEEPLPVGDADTFAVDIRILDGEIVLKGDSVFGGYLGAETGGFFLEGTTHCYKTGDIGYIRNRRLYCKGRRDSQIKYKGYRIELGDVEYNIGRIPGVKECAVVAKYADTGVVRAVKAFVTAEPGVTAEAIRAELQSRIPGYMMPKTIRIIDRMPMNPNGKVDRKGLSEW